MLERSLAGWKELEYEVVRDAYDNTITVCNMENFDPVGVHTGESIVIAPSQTLTDDEYNMLRTTSVKVIRHLGIVGECNIQYALHPHSREYCIIEVNARLSRSSALASKATGYPLAYVAAKLSLNKNLYELRNSITKTTTACFEPSLDYCVVKIPRWDLTKFLGTNRKIGSAMKSVGEVMSIGRTFEEAFQKALRMIDQGFKGFDPNVIPVSDDDLKNPTDLRALTIATALQKGYTVDRIHELTKIDRWFLHKLKSLSDLVTVMQGTTAEGLSRDLLQYAKKKGFSDSQIAKYVGSNEVAIRKIRKDFGLTPFIKQIDTVAAEYPAYTNYLYLTYNGSEDDIKPNTNGETVMVLGSGVYRIGSSVEFDYCAVGTVRELRRLGYQTIMINYNPETVSTDYDECDRLFFDELTFETVMDVYEHENPKGVILGMGGQIPNNLSTNLARQQVNILGTSAEMIDNAENRYKFSRMCDLNNIDQPGWKELTSVEDAKKFAEQVSYPVLLRPSYILSGTAMRVAHSAVDLENDFETACIVSRDYPVVISKFVQDAREIEVDAVAKNGEIVVYAVSEHIENAGVHSGDASIIHPAQTLTQAQIDGVTAIARKIAKALEITGPFNIQFLGKGEEIKVIECNLRASRSFPFVSKTKGVDMISIATQVIMGRDVAPPAETKYEHVGVKVAMFSFNRLAGSDPTLGVDMMSTGEVACFGATKEEAFLKAVQSSGIKIPKKNIFLSIGSIDRKQEFLPAVKELVALGYKLFGTVGTADYYLSQGIAVQPIIVPRSVADPIQLYDMLFANLGIELTVNIPLRNKYRTTTSFVTTGYLIRRMCIDRGISLITDVKCARLFVEGLRTVPRGPIVSKIDSQSALTTVQVPGLLAFVNEESSQSASEQLTAIANAGFSSAVVVSQVGLMPDWSNADGCSCCCH